MSMESHSRSNGNRHAVTKRITSRALAKRKQRQSGVLFLFFIIIFDEGDLTMLLR